MPFLNFWIKTRFQVAVRTSVALRVMYDKLVNFAKWFGVISI